MDADRITAELGVSPEVIGGRRQWWLRGAPQDRHELALSLGLVETRRVLQLRRPLPIEETTEIAVRPFDPATDTARWLEVNAAAFAQHPDQGQWTEADLNERLSADWFDPRGFLVHDGADGVMDGFCWTKVHSSSSPPLGEIYVIGIHPDVGGRGLGRKLTIAGLDDLAERRGLHVAMLYVESDNERARAMYQALDFRLHHDDVAYEPA